MEVIGWYGCTRGSRADTVAISGETLVQRCLPGPGHPTWRALPPPPPTIVPACQLNPRDEAVYMEYHTIRMSVLGDINIGCCSFLGGVVQKFVGTVPPVGGFSERDTRFGLTGKRSLASLTHISG